MPETAPPGGDGGHPPGTFGHLLLKHRRAAGLTQEELAAYSGVSVRTISDLERGRTRGPQRRSVEALAKVLGLSGATLVEFLTSARAGRNRGAGNTRVNLCELPPTLPDLIGRERELAWLQQMASELQTHPSGYARAVVITGQPGVGKTSLVVRAGYELGDRFPDGVYFLDLRGTSGPPLDPREILARVLRSFGIEQGSLPSSLDERVSLYRSILRDQRALLIFDDARDESQVRPLLTGSSSSLVTVTARRTLAGLDGVHRLELDVLSPEASVHLLDLMIGNNRVTAERTAAVEVAALCGHLPLALRIAGTRLSARRQWSIRHLANQLTDQQRRLSVLSAGDRQVRAAFDLSYQQLSPRAQLVFRRAALVPGSDFGASLVAVAAGIDEATAAEALDELVDASMLLPARDGRYRFHDLIRLFASERLDEERAEPEAVTSAERRMLDWLMSNALVAGQMVQPDPVPRDSSSARFQDMDGAVRWLDDETAGWSYALRREAANGQHARVVAVVRALHWYSDMRIERCPWEEIFTLGVNAAQAIGSRHDEVVLLNFLGWAQYYCENRYNEALQTHQLAREGAQQIGDRREEAWATAYQASIHRRLGRLEEAARGAQKAVSLFAEAEYPMGEAVTRNLLGVILRSLGKPKEALKLHQRVLNYYRQGNGVTVNKNAMIQTLLAIAEDLIDLHRWQDALKALDEAYRLSVEIGVKESQAIALRERGRVLLAQGRTSEAILTLNEALEILFETETRWDLAFTEQLLGDAAEQAGDREQAIAWWRQALELCQPPVPGSVVHDRLIKTLQSRLADTTLVAAGDNLAG